MKHLFETKADLRLARGLLRSAKTSVRYPYRHGGHIYVCNAIKEIANNKNDERYTKIASIIVAEIAKRLKGEATVDCWLLFLAKPMVKYDDVTRENMQIYRARWVDSMIKELQ